MIYLDNAATSYPKPASVIREVNRSIRRYCGNPGRSGHKLSLYSAEMVYRAREAISALLGVDNPEQIVFTLNATYAINLALKAEIEGPATVLTSDVEHNAVIRPLEALKKSVGIKTRTFSTDKDLEASIEKEIDDDTRFIVTTLRSNVTGQDVDLSTLKRVANRHHLTLILDASQYIGHKRIDLSGLDSYVLCAPFHKGLLHNIVQNLQSGPRCPHSGCQGLGRSGCSRNTRTYRSTYRFPGRRIQHTHCCCR